MVVRSAVVDKGADVAVAVVAAVVAASTHSQAFPPAPFEFHGMGQILSHPLQKDLLCMNP